jgi:hypothetical protein
LCIGCSDHPTSEEQALVAKVEGAILLPKGAGSPRCYERHYALLQGKAIDEYVGASLSGLRGRALLVGKYQLGPHPGIYWAKSAKDLPQEIADGGCRNIHVWYVLGDPLKKMDVSCSPNFAGVEPTEVTPPVTC